MAKKGGSSKDKDRISLSTDENQRKRTLTQLTEIGKGLGDIERAWDAIIKGLHQRAQDHFDSAVDKLHDLSSTLRDQAIVDMGRISKVLAVLNRSVTRKTSKDKMKVSDIFEVEDVFKDTTKRIDRVMDRETGKALKELRARLDRLLEARAEALKQLDVTVKGRLRSTRASLRRMRAMVPRSDTKRLERISRSCKDMLEDLSEISVEKLRTRKKDLQKMVELSKVIEGRSTALIEKLTRPKGKDKG